MHESQMHIISSPSQKPVFVRSPVNTQHTVPGQLKGSIPAFGYCARCEFPFLFSVKNCPSPPMDKIKAIYYSSGLFATTIPVFDLIPMDWGETIQLSIEHKYISVFTITSPIL